MICSCKVNINCGGKRWHVILFCPLHAAAEEMLKELVKTDKWFEELKQDHHEKIVQVQTFKDACANWDNP